MVYSGTISGRRFGVIALVCLATVTIVLLHSVVCVGSPLESGSAGGDLYVDVNDPSSNDDNPGTESEPLRTIQEAANRAKPGTIVNVKSGTYNETVEVTTSGVPGAPISFVSCGNGRAHVVATGYACFNLESVECVVIDGFELSGAMACGSAAHGGGIRAFPESLADTEGDRDTRAVYWDFGARYCVFSNNIVHDNDAGIWLVLSHNNIIRDNVVTGSNEAPIRLKHSHNNEVLNNLTYNNGKTEEWGICFYGAPYTVVRHNTVYEPGGGAVYIYEGTSNLNGATPGSTDYCPPSSNSQVFDNIGQVCGSGATLVIGSSTTTDRDPALDELYGPVDNQYHHNLWFRVTESKPVVSWGDLTAQEDHMAMLTLEEFRQKQAGYGDDSLVTDPLFADAGNADFGLQEGSPAQGSASDGYDRGMNPGVAFQVMPNLGGAYPASSTGSDLAVLEGVGFGATLGDSYVSFGGKPAPGYSSWSDTLIVAEVPGGITGPVDVTVTTAGGDSRPASYWAGASTTWYLSEGSTGEGFETWVLVQNPGSTEAEVVVTYMTPSGPVSGPCATVPANSRQTFNVADTVPGEWEVSTHVSSDQPVIAERAVYWDHRTGGHDSVGVTNPSTTWYLSEGSTGEGFETWVLVQNPGSTEAEVVVTYMTPSGPVSGPCATVPANSRQTFNVADTVPGEWEVSTHVSSDQPVIAERAVYWDHRTGGHDSVGVTNPSTTWYLSEGSTGEGFETWVLVQNPGSTEAEVVVTYMTPSGPVSGPCATVPANSRQTFNVADTVPGEWEVSTHVSSDQPVIAERAVYWDGREGGHDSVGVTNPSTTWYLPEGSTGEGFETWVLVQNPGSTEAEVVVTYMTPSGPVSGPCATVPANSRQTFNVADTVPGEWEVSTHVSSDQPVIAERAVYWDGREGGHDSVGFAGQL